MNAPLDAPARGPADEEVRELAGRLRSAWRRLPMGTTTLAMFPPQVRARIDRVSADRAEARAELTQALRARGGGVLDLGDGSLLTLNADGDGPAFLPDPKRVGNAKERRAATSRLAAILDAQARREVDE